MAIKKPDPESKGSKILIGIMLLAVLVGGGLFLMMKKKEEKAIEDSKKETDSKDSSSNAQGDTAGGDGTEQNQNTGGSSMEKSDKDNTIVIPIPKIDLRMTPDGKKVIYAMEYGNNGLTGTYSRGESDVSMAKGGATFVLKRIQDPNASMLKMSSENGETPEGSYYVQFGIKEGNDPLNYANLDMDTGILYLDTGKQMEVPLFHEQHKSV